VEVGAPARAERAFRAMGTDAHVFIWQRRDDPTPPDEVLDRAEDEIERREALWSRFRATSDISRLNAAPGSDISIAPETIDLFEFCLDARTRTVGSKRPSVLAALLAAGYDRTFDEVRANAAERPIAVHQDELETAAAARPADLHIDASARTARVPLGTAVDVGGAAKGWTADQVAGLLVEECGVVAACVNLGGDLRTTGTVPDPDGLIVGVADPFDESRHLALLRVHDAGVATSARTRRTWATDAGPMHHLIDPRTGRPARTNIAAVTVVAPSGALAEIIAKAVFLDGAGERAAWLAELDASALVVTDDGDVHIVGDLPEA